MKTPKNVYRRFIEFEEKAAEIYFRLASRFSKNRDLSAFWLEMAMQEKQHAGLLQFCVCEGLFAPDLPNASEVQKLDRFFHKIERRIDNSGLEIKDAFLAAMELECSEINGIHNYLTTPLHSFTYLLRRKITTSLPKHVDELLSMARRFGVGDDAIKELERLKKQSSSSWREHKLRRYPPRSNNCSQDTGGFYETCNPRSSSRPESKTQRQSH